jgi:demethylmenaquinone methyltransferase/2-methoxy-6-polyprenyl-1,4-benzoquinol methylase
MRNKNNKWIGEHPEADPTADAKHEKLTHFGYQVIPEKEKEKKVLRHFNSVARRYDFMNTLLSFGIHYIWKRVAINCMCLKPGDRILDVCGGTGDLSIMATRKVGINGQVILYDINRAMIQVGRAKATNANARKRIVHVQGDAERIAFSDHRFDAAMVGFGIRNVTHMQKGFEEMYRILKPGGTLMCLEFSKPTAPLFRWLYDIYSFHIMPFLGEILAGSRQAYTHLPESIRMFPLPDELNAILEKIGFCQVTHHPLTNGIAVIHLGKKMENRSGRQG